MEVMLPKKDEHAVVDSPLFWKGPRSTTDVVAGVGVYGVTCVECDTTHEERLRTNWPAQQLVKKLRGIGWLFEHSSWTCPTCRVAHRRMAQAAEPAPTPPPAPITYGRKVEAVPLEVAVANFQADTGSSIVSTQITVGVRRDRLWSFTWTDHPLYRAVRDRLGIRPDGGVRVRVLPSFSSADMTLVFGVEGGRKMSLISDSRNVGRVFASFGYRHEPGLVPDKFPVYGRTFPAIVDLDSCTMVIQDAYKVLGRPLHVEEPTAVDQEGGRQESSAQEVIPPEQPGDPNIDDPAQLAENAELLVSILRRLLEVHPSFQLEVVDRKVTAWIEEEQTIVVKTKRDL
jgi:hypothetical protein